MIILFYSPFNRRARDAESVMLALKEMGHKVISLSQAKGKEIHPLLKGQGIETISYEVRHRFLLLMYLKHIIYLIRFCRDRKVDVVFSHLESANFVAVMAQFFIRTKVYINRHHVDEASLRGFDTSLFYRLTYKLAKGIIAVSDKSVEYMIEREGIRPSRITKINLAYDFSLYPKPDPKECKSIRDSLQCDFVLLTACRLTKYKRPYISILLLKKLTEQGVHAKLIILGEGEEKSKLEDLAQQLDLVDRVLLFGHVPNLLDYMGAADLVIHPSVLESSCVLVKEAGLLGKIPVVCKGVGDFDSYLINYKNAILVNRDNYVQEAFDFISGFIERRHFFEAIGETLFDDIQRVFSIEANIGAYSDLLDTIKVRRSGS